MAKPHDFQGVPWCGKQDLKRPGTIKQRQQKLKKAYFSRVSDNLRKPQKTTINDNYIHNYIQIIIEESSSGEVLNTPRGRIQKKKVPDFSRTFRVGGRNRARRETRSVFHDQQRPNVQDLQGFSGNDEKRKTTLYTPGRGMNRGTVNRLPRIFRPGFSK